VRGILTESTAATKTFQRGVFNGLGIECLALVSEFKSTLKRAENFPVPQVPALKALGYQPFE